jgi:hypothetical protein
VVSANQKLILTTISGKSRGEKIFLGKLAKLPGAAGRALAFLGQFQAPGAAAPGLRGFLPLAVKGGAPVTGSFGSIGRRGE